MSRYIKNAVAVTLVVPATVLALFVLSTIMDPLIAAASVLFFLITALIAVIASR